MVSPPQFILLLQLMGIGLNNVAGAGKNLVKMQKPKLYAQCSFQGDDPSGLISKLSPRPRPRRSSQNLQGERRLSLSRQEKPLPHPYLCCSALGWRMWRLLASRGGQRSIGPVGARAPAGFASHLISWKLPGGTSVLSSRETLNLSAANGGWRRETSKLKQPTRKQPKRWTAPKASDFSLLWETEVMGEKEQTQEIMSLNSNVLHCIAGRATGRDDRRASSEASFPLVLY